MATKFTYLDNTFNIGPTTFQDGGSVTVQDGATIIGVDGFLLVTTS